MLVIQFVIALTFTAVHN